MAEDELLISECISEFLRDVGCVVIGPVASLAEALNAARNDDIDIALLDINLGDSKVYPAADELARRGIPFILLTGDRKLSGTSGHFGNAPRLTKPFTLDQLMVGIQALGLEHRGEKRGPDGNLDRAAGGPSLERAEDGRLRR